MDYNKYAIFLEVAKCNNISKAAENLGYTQSAVSHTLKRMENDCNLPLFYRNRNGAFLTPNGETLLPHIMQLVQSEMNLNQAILSLHDLHMGTLSIGTYSSISRNWLPEIIHRFEKDYPSIKINFREGGNQDIFKWIDSHDVDLALASKHPHIPDDLEWIPLLTDPLLGLFPKDYPLKSQENYPLKNFNKKKFIISALGTDIDIHRILNKNHIAPDIQYSSTDDITIISMVSHHLGVSILPELVIRGHDSSVIALPLQPECSRELGILVPKISLSSPVTSRFIDYTKQYIVEQRKLTAQEQTPCSPCTK